MAFGLQSRQAQIDYLKNKTMDLIVIGGGITGAGVALDAALRGMKVALIEMNDFASGTSSRSTKFIHGGLRYLKNFEIGLVREYAQERKILFQNAPYLIHPEPILLPVTKNGKMGRLSTNIGLWIYDMLAKVGKDEHFKALNKQEALEKEPLLNEDLLLGGDIFYEYRTDDARLVLEVLKTAAKAGAVLLSQVKARDFITDDLGQVCGLKLRDEWNDEKFKVQAKVVVNAAGPWSEKVSALGKKKAASHKLQLTKGVHIVFDHAKFPIQQSLYFEIPDGRMIFAIPRGKYTYLGTTDTVYKKKYNYPRVEKEDVKYLIKSINQTFQGVELKAKDVISGWAGLRPLIEDEDSPKDPSRKHEIFESPNGLITITGGKLTGYRKMAEVTVDVVAAQLMRTGMTINACSSDAHGLVGQPHEGLFKHEELERYLAAKGVDPYFAEQWTERYGYNALAVARNLLEDRSELGHLLAELHYGIEEEAVLHITDFAVRRTSMIHFDRPMLQRHQEALVQALCRKTGSYLPDEMELLEEAYHYYHIA